MLRFIVVLSLCFPLFLNATSSIGKEPMLKTFQVKEVVKDQITQVDFNELKSLLLN